jgi:hypothetical protein
MACLLPPTTAMISDVTVTAAAEVRPIAEPLTMNCPWMTRIAPYSSELTSWGARAWSRDLVQSELLHAGRTLAELASLAENWDGYGAARLEQATVANARAVIEALVPNVPAPEIVPNPNGTITLSWESAAGEAHLEIGLTRFGFFAKSAGQKSKAQGKLGELYKASGALSSFLWETLYPGARRTPALTLIVFSIGKQEIV